MAADPRRSLGRGSSRTPPRTSVAPLGTSLSGADDPLAAFPAFAATPQEQMQFQFQQQLELQQQQFAISTGTGTGGGSARISATSISSSSLGAFSPLAPAAMMDTSAVMLERAQATAQAVSAAAAPPAELGPYYTGPRTQQATLSMAQPHTGAAFSSASPGSTSPSFLATTGTLPSVTASSPPPPQLYKTSKMRRPEMWQFIRLVVPDPPDVAAGKEYSNQDAREAYCLKCKLRMHYNTGSSNNVSRHMAKFHPLDLANYAQKVADKKKKLRSLHGRLGVGHGDHTSHSSSGTGLTTRNAVNVSSSRLGGSSGKRKLRAIAGGTAAHAGSASTGAVNRRIVNVSPVGVRTAAGKMYGGFPGDSSLTLSEDEVSDELRPAKSKKKMRRTASVESADGNDGGSGVHSFHDDSEFFLDDEEEEEEDEALNSHETETLNALIARWVCKHYHPLGITEDPELQDIISYALALRKQVALPSQNVVRASVESLTAKTRLDMLRQFSNEMMFFAMATEVWTTTENEAFLSISIHYNTDKFERRHFTLDVREYNGPLTADAKRELLDALLSRWNLDSRYLCSMMWQPYPTSGYPRQYGSGSSGSSSSRNYEIGMVHTQQTEGVSHAFQLILAPLLHSRRALAADNMRNFFHDNMANQTIDCMPLECQRGAAFLRAQVEFFRGLAQFFTGHPRAVARLNKLAAGTSSPHHHAHRLVTDAKGNWVSTFDMLKRLLRKKRAIHEFYAYLDTHEGSLEFQHSGSFPRREPTRAQWCALECLLQLLQPFESVAGAIGKDKYTTLALTLPLLQFLMRDLEKKSDFERLFNAYNLPWMSAGPTPAAGNDCGGVSDPVRSGDEAALNGGDGGDNDENAVAATIRTSLEAVRAYLHMQFVVHFARPCNGLMWLSQLDPRFVRMRFLSDDERLACKTRLGERCFLISHFLQSMANQQNRSGGSNGSSNSGTSGGLAMSGVGSGVDGSGYPRDSGGGSSVFDSAVFLDESASKEDHDTSSFLRELLFDDAPDDVPPQPPQAPQQPHVEHRHLRGATATRSHQYSGTNGELALGDGLLHPEPTDSDAPAAAQTAAATAAAAFATRAIATDVSLVPILSGARIVEDEQDAALRKRVTDEVNVYYEDVSAAIAPAVRDPMRWWKQNGARYPLLGPLARKWLSAIGSVRLAVDALRVLPPPGRHGARSSGGSAVNGAHTGGAAATGAGSGGVSGAAGATPSPMLAEPPRPEPDLIRDLVFVHDNC